METVKNNSKDLVVKVTDFLKQGKVLILPTDTIYGFVCDARNREAVQRIFKLKNRSHDKPLPVFVSKMSMAKELAHINKEQEQYLNKVWPGKVTAILKKKKNLPFTKDTIALRMPDYDLLKIDIPLAQTSVNISGAACFTNVKKIKQIWDVDLLVDAGELDSEPSRIIDLTKASYKRVR